MHPQEAKNHRLYPYMWHSRYYYLTQLRKAIEETIRYYVAPLGRVQQIVDYGCGQYPYKPLFLPFCEKYIGVDLPENTKAELHISPRGEVPLSDEQVQIVLSTQVLEHVPNPNFYLQEAYRILAPQGLLILSTHGYWIFHPDPTDFWRWTSMGLQKIIQENGFKILHFKGIIGRAAIGIQLVQDGILFKLPKFIRPFFALPMQGLAYLLDKIHSQKARNLDAGNFIVVAQKANSLSEKNI